MSVNTLTNKVLGTANKLCIPKTASENRSCNLRYHVSICM